MRENGTSANGGAIPRDELAGVQPEDTGLILDDELKSAATPFLWLLSSIVVAVSGYLVYSYLHG
ncbi:MAG: hypothetical protein ACLPPF_10675 [Rhodomicrobium sp.]